jgi:hypothetical protein
MRPVETATVAPRGAELSAALSLAKAAGVTVTAAARHLQNGTARMLIESRFLPRTIEEGHLGRLRRLADLKVREIVLFGGG